MAPHRVQNFEREDGAGVLQTGQTSFASGAPHTSQNCAFLSETMAPQTGQTGSPCGVTGSSISGAPHRSQNRELVSGAGAPQFPHFLAIFLLVNSFRLLHKDCGFVASGADPDPVSRWKIFFAGQRGFVRTRSSINLPAVYWPYGLDIPGFRNHSGRICANG